MLCVDLEKIAAGRCDCLLLHHQYSCQHVDAYLFISITLNYDIFES